MTKTPLVSVIIPVYNVEKYLEKCLDSVINQTFQDLEIICINDGSTDNSLQILEEYSQKDERIIIINQNNKGLSGARNSGLKVAKGEYIYFLDSDDWIKNNLLEKCYTKMIELDVDVLVFGTYNVYSNFIIENKRKISNFIKKYNIKALYFEDNPLIYTQSCTAWTKFFKKNFLDNNNLHFEEEVRFSEDAVFWMQLLYCNPKIGLLDECLYYYRIKRSDALTSNNSNIMKKQWNAYEYIKNTEYYKKANDINKLLTLDFFAIAMMCHYSNIEAIRMLGIYERDLISTEIEYKKFKKYNLFKYSGYRQVKFRYIYTIAKKLVLLFLKFSQKGAKNNAY